MKEREKFGSRLGFILVSAGCAVGLGNVWKFPYICGENGGAAFIVIYLLFLLILGFPILMCEFSVGRASQRGMSRAYDVLEPEGSFWHHTKWMSIIGNYMLLMFYTMVGGWMLCYAYLTASGKLQTMSAQAISDDFQALLSSPGELTFWMVLAVLVSIGICALGLENGIEKVTKVMMTILIVLMIVLAVNSLVLKGAGAGIRFYLVPNMQHVLNKGIGSVVFAAMSHAFFTLSVGIGSMEIFGSYLEKDRTLPGEAASIVAVDTFVALMAGFIIIPACFAYGVQPDSGPSLLFITLPNVFNNMALGRVWGTCFFIFMSFAALSTIIAVTENIISFYIDGLGWSRKRAVQLNAPLLILLSLPAVFGYNIWSALQPLGAGSSIMDLEDFLVSYNLLPLGSLIFVLFCTGKNGWGWEKFLAEVNTGSGRKMKGSVRFYMTYILPLIIVFIYLKGYYDMFVGMGTATLIKWMLFALLLLGFIFGIALKKKRKSPINR